MSSYRAGLYIATDESLDTGRRNTMDRLEGRAERVGLSVVLANGVLSIDGNDVFFSLEQGHLFSRVNVSMHFRCLSYNCRGFKRAYIKTL